MAFTREEAAFPTWAAILILVVVLAAVALLLLRARMGHAPDQRPALHAQDEQVDPAAPVVADRVVDGGQAPTGDLLRALAVTAEGRAFASGGGPGDEDAWATALGLRAKIASNDAAGAEPHILWGTRGGRQVFVRLGVDEVGEGMPASTGRGLRQIVVVRAAFATFELRGDDGTLAPAGGGAPPAAVIAAIERLARSPGVWRDVGVVAGPQGLVTTRPRSDDDVNGWIHDLWLAEHLAAATDAEPLLAERIGPAWKVPYGVAGKRRGRTG